MENKATNLNVRFSKVFGYLAYRNSKDNTWTRSLKTRLMEQFKTSGLLIISAAYFDGAKIAGSVRR